MKSKAEIEILADASFIDVQKHAPIYEEYDYTQGFIIGYTCAMEEYASQQKTEIATEISRFDLNELVVKYLRSKKIGEQLKFDGLYSDIKELILDFALDELKTRIQPSDLQKEVERLKEMKQKLLIQLNKNESMSDFVISTETVRAIINEALNK